MQFLSPEKPGFRLVNGTLLYLDSLQEATYSIEDVATVLGRIQRFNNHSPFKKYSVAEHCVHASRLYAANRKGALMHDAPEWLVGDLPTPIKQRTSGYKDIEAAVSEDLQRRFDYEEPEKYSFKVIDNVLFQMEHALLFDFPLPYSGIQIGFGFWEPEEATKRFLQRFGELFK